MRRVKLADIYSLYFSVAASGGEKNGTFNKILLQPIWHGLIGGAISSLFGEKTMNEIIK